MLGGTKQRPGRLAQAGANDQRTVDERPQLIFFHARNSGRSRRVDGYLSQVLQRRRNHESFRIYHVDVDEHADLADRFRIANVPTIVVVEGKRVCGRLETPRGCRDIEQLLAPWLQ
jgi:thioredoxin-like negative regulator of GroEL